MNERELFRQKCSELHVLLNVPQRCALKPPSRLDWLVQDVKMGGTVIVPKGYCRGAFYSNDYTKVGLDVLARTYCLLEEISAWLDRCDAGMKRHQAEMEKQAAPKIARLLMAAGFEPAVKANDDDTPF